MANPKCISCGVPVSQAWLDENELLIPLCPSCYGKATDQFEHAELDEARLESLCFKNSIP